MISWRAPSLIVAVAMRTSCTTLVLNEYVHYVTSQTRITGSGTNPEKLGAGGSGGGMYRGLALTLN